MTVTLRKFNSLDLQDLVTYANNKKIADNLMDAFPHPYTEEDAEKFLEKFTSVDPPEVQAICADGMFCGAIGVHIQTDVMRNNAELGYWVAESFWGKGIASEAVVLAVEYGFQTFDINRIYARPYPHNKASQRILEKAGFVLEAQLEKTLVKNGEVMDELIYAIRK